MHLMIFSQGLTPLYYTTMKGGDSSCAELLLNDHAEIGFTDNQGFQEIHHVSRHNSSSFYFVFVLWWTSTTFFLAGGDEWLGPACGASAVLWSGHQSSDDHWQELASSPGCSTQSGTMLIQGQKQHIVSLPVPGWVLGQILNGVCHHN